MQIFKQNCRFKQSINVKKKVIHKNLVFRKYFEKGFDVTGENHHVKTFELDLVIINLFNQIICIALIHTVQENSDTNCLNNKILKALRNKIREVIEIRLGGRKFHKRKTVRKCRFSTSTIRWYAKKVRITKRSQSFTRKQLKKGQLSI